MREIIYPSPHCHHQDDSCIKMGSDERHFNVSLIVRYKVTKQCSQITTFLKREESRSGIEPSSFSFPAERLTARPNRLTPTHVYTGNAYMTVTLSCFQLSADERIERITLNDTRLHNFEQPFDPLSRQ